MIAKRFISLFLCFMMLAAVACFAGCSPKKGKEVLKVYNWEDYISDEDDEESGLKDLISAFEKEYGVVVEYSTFGTNENMYNELKINAAGYDLVCPSDYMIMRMIKEDMVEPFSDEFQKGEYRTYASPYLQELFEKNGWSDYAAAYMWGTMGFVYNPESVSYTHLTLPTIA